MLLNQQIPYFAFSAKTSLLIILTRFTLRGGSKIFHALRVNARAANPKATLQCENERKLIDINSKPDSFFFPLPHFLSRFL